MSKKKMVTIVTLMISVMVLVVFGIKMTTSANASQNDNAEDYAVIENEESGQQTADRDAGLETDGAAMDSETAMGSEMTMDSEIIIDSETAMDSEITMDSETIMDSEAAIDSEMDLETEERSEAEELRAGNSEMTAFDTTRDIKVREEKKEEQGTVGYILIGDSRFVCMDRVVDVESHANQFIIARSGAGYKFLVSEALPKAAIIEKAHPEIDTWKYIINLGVNDLQSAWRYARKYKELAASKNLVIQSVNPIQYSTIPQNTQSNVETFNQKIRTIKGIEYLDTYAMLLSNGFSTIDGLHYTEETSKYIYRCIQDYILDNGKI